MCNTRAPDSELTKFMTVIVSFDVQAGDDEARIKRKIELALVESVKKILDEIERKHHTRIDMKSFAMMAMEKFYKDKYKELARTI